MGDRSTEEKITNILTEWYRCKGLNGLLMFLSFFVIPIRSHSKTYVPNYGNLILRVHKLLKGEAAEIA